MKRLFPKENWFFFLEMKENCVGASGHGFILSSPLSQPNPMAYMYTTPKPQRKSPLPKEKKKPILTPQGIGPQRSKRVLAKSIKLHCYHNNTPPPHISFSSSAPPVACSASARSDLSMDPRRLPILLSLLLAFFSAVAASDEIHGCGGFVEVGVPHVARSPSAVCFTLVRCGLLH